MVVTPVTCRLLIDIGQPGAWNMAVDECLLQSAANRAVTTLRFYTWREPTLTLGYFQNYAERRAHAHSLPCPCLRRTTGGGAIVHDQELTYSLAVPLDRGRFATQRYYTLVHDALRDVLAAHGVNVGRSPGTRAETPAPFLCFQRRSTGDVVTAENWKILGSARRRAGTALLQHGSLLLKRSRQAPELPGLFDLVSNRRLPERDELISQWCRAICLRLSCGWQPGKLDQAEQIAAQQSLRERFGAPDWTHRR